MKFKKLLAASAFSILTIQSYSATAQMRPECGADSEKPGACFFNVNTGGTLICEDGGISWPFSDGELKRSTGKVNPKGKISVHLSAGNVSAFACTAEDAAAGICPPNDVTGLYSGVTNLKVDGFITEGGSLSCPYKATAQGTLFRSVGSGVEEVEIDLVVHLVKDRGGDTCRPQQCRIFAVE
jgi:hypothetical protein